MILIWKLIVLEILIWLNTIYDGARIINDKPIYHGWEFIVRGIFITGLALILNWSWDAWKEVLFFGFVFWQFDYTLNWIRSKHWWHLGNNIFDKILKGKNLRYWRLGLKIALVVGSFILLVL